MGLDVDKFELRAFIQFELGIEGARLVHLHHNKHELTFLLDAG